MDANPPPPTPPGYVVLRTDGGLVPLVLRLLLAGVFLWQGVPKFTMTGGTARFEAMGFPFPGFFAPLVGGFEVVCALLLLAGLGVRVAVLPLGTILLGAMAVHLVQGTATAPGGILFEGVLLVFVILLGWTGAGRASLDRYLVQGQIHQGQIHQGQIHQGQIHQGQGSDTTGNRERDAGSSSPAK